MKPIKEGEAERKEYQEYFKKNKFFRKDLIKVEKYVKGAPSFMKRGEIGMATQMLRDVKFVVDNVLEEIADEFQMPELLDHVVNENKTICPQCEGKGCDHCDGKGYHVGEAFANDAQRKAVWAAKNDKKKAKKEAATPKSNPEYYKGLSKKDKEERQRVIKKRSKMKDNDPDAYKGFRSDKGVKTKPSKWNAKFKKMYGELSEDQKKIVHEKLSAKIKKALKNKAKKANAPQGALTTVYNKGLAAWKTGHRPGASQHAWAMARVNSFLAGGPARKVDAAQWKQVSKHRKKK